MYNAVVLAAGYSSRAKTNKLALRLGEKTVIERTVASLFGVCDRIIVVTGHYHDEISSILAGDERIVLVKNEGYDIGMFSSVQVGMTFAYGNVFILPGDCPMIQKETLKMMIEALEEDVCDDAKPTSDCCRDSKHQWDMFVPAFEGHKGHPLLIRQCLTEALLNEDYQSNLKVFRNRYRLKVIETDDPGVLQDIDTIEAYEHLAQIQMEGSHTLEN